VSAAPARLPLAVCAFYFWYFLFVGTNAPYLSLYLSAAGLGIAQIGLIMSMSPATRLVGPLFWGWIADRSGARVGVMRACAFLAMGAVIALWFAADHFIPVLVLATLVFFANAGQVPIGEALAHQASGGDAGRYSRMRVWGSIGFIVGVLAMAPALELTGILSLPWWLAAMMIALLAALLLMPGGAGRPRAVLPGASPIRSSLRDPALVAFFVSLFLMIDAHSAFYAFFSLFLERHGYGKPAIGALWAVGVLAEMALFYAAMPIFARFDALALLRFSMAVAVLRFALVAVSDGSVWLLVVSQLMHAVTFGLHHSASQALLQRWYEPGSQARAQGLFSTIGYGLGGTLGGLAASALWLGWSPEAAFGGAALAAALGWASVHACVRFGGGPRSRL
jgi:PPP family 3-phenylpropionic acid transporter